MRERQIHEWERVHSLLLQKQSDFEGLSVRHQLRHEDASSQVLDGVRGEIEELRRLAGIKFKIAFGLVED